VKPEEITKIPQQPNSGFSLDDFDVGNMVHVGTAENIPLVLFNSTDGKYTCYALIQDDLPTATVVGRWGTLNGPAFFIERTYTVPTYRNKGMMTAMYKALYTKYGIRLVSDVEQSPGTITIWKKLADVLPVQVVDVVNKTIVPLATVNDIDLYDEPRKLRLMLENTQSEAHPDILVPDPIVDGILDDYIIYTHEDSNNQYI
jgi:hypothetical protein